MVQNTPHEGPKNLFDVIRQQAAFNVASLYVAAEAYNQARVDTLTQMPNRLGLHEAYEELQASDASQQASELGGNRHAKPGTHSILMMDIDHFKQINDKLGHDEGDEVLKTVSAIIKDRPKRDHDVSVRLNQGGQSEKYAGRWGGEEFAVLLPNTDADGASLVAEDIRQQVETTDQATISIGVAEIDLSEPLNANIKRADQALYFAKDHGRNQVIVFDGTQLSPSSKDAATCNFKLV